MPGTSIAANINALKESKKSTKSKTKKSSTNPKTKKSSLNPKTKKSSSAKVGRGVNNNDTAKGKGRSKETKKKVSLDGKKVNKRINLRK
jgi:hypothetical protein